MKIALLAAAVILTPVSLHAQYTDVMPPEQNAKPMAMPAKAPVPPSNSLNLSFQGKTITLSVEDLLNLPQTTVHVHNAHSNTDEDYTGPLVADVLARIGLKSNGETHSLILHSTVVATGTDHYFVIYSGAEVEPDFSTGKVIVAVMKSGLPIKDGRIQLVNTTDAKPARWVHGLASLNVMSLAPTN